MVPPKVLLVAWLNVSEPLLLMLPCRLGIPGEAPGGQYVCSAGVAGGAEQFQDRAGNDLAGAVDGAEVGSAGDDQFVGRREKVELAGGVTAKAEEFAALDVEGAVQAHAAGVPAPRRVKVQRGAGTDPHRAEVERRKGAGVHIDRSRL